MHRGKWVRPAKPAEHLQVAAAFTAVDFGFWCLAAIIDVAGDR